MPVHNEATHELGLFLSRLLMTLLIDDAAISKMTF